MGAEGRERGRVELPDSLLENAISQAGGAVVEAVLLSPIWPELKRLCGEGWLGSPTMLVALRVRRVPKMSKREGSTAFTVLCRVLRLEAVQLPYHTVMQAGQDAVDGPSVEGAHDGWEGSCSLQLAEEVEAPLGLLGQ